VFIAGDKLYVYDAAIALWKVTDYVDEFLFCDVSERLPELLGVINVWSNEGHLTKLCDAEGAEGIARFAKPYLRDNTRAKLIDRQPYLAVMAGGLVHDTRTGTTRPRTREDYFTSES